MPGPPQRYKQWVHYLRGMIPGDIRVMSYADSREMDKIDIFTSANADGVVAATVGLMDYDQGHNPAVAIYTELLLDARGQQTKLCDVLSTIAFFVTKNGWKPAPGVIFTEMIECYEPSLDIKHVMFIAPFQWKTAMTKVELEGKVIHPLLAVPITESERRFVNDQGDEPLMRLWKSANTDVLDWTRRSAVS
jgi:hypothetical protein